VRPSFTRSSAAIRSSPLRPIGSGHVGDKSLQFGWNPGTIAWARLRAPEQAIQVAMPTHKRLGTDNREQVAPLDEPRQRDQGDPRRVVGATRSNLALEIGGELLSQE
jgi:hypothetical protein